MPKTTLPLLILLLSLFVYSCNKDDALTTGGMHPGQDEHLIGLITGAPSVQPVDVTQLQSNIRSYVMEHHAPMGIAWAFTAGQYGHEILLENGMCLYFDQYGNHLDHDGLHGDHGNHHGGGDPGINFCMTGDTLTIDQLPTPSFEFIADHYSTEDILFIVIKPSGNFGVEIATGEILMFDSDGQYIMDCEYHDGGGHGHLHGMGDFMGWHCETVDMPGGQGGPHGHMGGLPGSGVNCWGGSSSSVDDLPAAIIDYITENYPDFTILNVTQTYNGNYFLRLSDCVRVIFDSDSNVLFDSGQ